MKEIRLIPIPLEATDFEIEQGTLKSELTYKAPMPGFGMVGRLRTIDVQWTFLGTMTKGEIDFEPGEDLVSDEPLPHIFSDHPDKDKSKMFKDYVKEVFIECVINPIIQSENLKGERFAVIVKD